jgi:hypothetical protein
MAYAYAGVCALLALVFLPLIIEGEAPRLAIAGQPSLSRPVIPATPIIAYSAGPVQDAQHLLFQFLAAYRPPHGTLCLPLRQRCPLVILPLSADQGDLHLG